MRVFKILFGYFILFFWSLTLFAQGENKYPLATLNAALSLTNQLSEGQDFYGDLLQELKAKTKLIPSYVVNKAGLESLNASSQHQVLQYIFHSLEINQKYPFQVHLLKGIYGTAYNQKLLDDYYQEEKNIFEKLQTADPNKYPALDANDLAFVDHLEEDLVRLSTQKPQSSIKDWAIVSAQYPELTEKLKIVNELKDALDHLMLTYQNKLDARYNAIHLENDIAKDLITVYRNKNGSFFTEEDYLKNASDLTQIESKANITIVNGQIIYKMTFVDFEHTFIFHPAAMDRESDLYQRFLARQLTQSGISGIGVSGYSNIEKCVAKMTGCTLGRNIIEVPLDESGKILDTKSTLRPSLFSAKIHFTPFPKISLPYTELYRKAVSVPATMASKAWAVAMIFSSTAISLGVKFLAGGNIDEFRVFSAIAVNSLLTFYIASNNSTFRNVMDPGDRWFQSFKASFVDGGKFLTIATLSTFLMSVDQSITTVGGFQNALGHSMTVLSMAGQKFVAGFNGASVLGEMIKIVGLGKIGSFTAKMGIKMTKTARITTHDVDLVPKFIPEWLRNSFLLKKYKDEKIKAYQAENFLYGEVTSMGERLDTFDVKLMGVDVGALIVSTKFFWGWGLSIFYAKLRGVESSGSVQAVQELHDFKLMPFKFISFLTAKKISAEKMYEVTKASKDSFLETLKSWRESIFGELEKETEVEKKEIKKSLLTHIEKKKNQGDFSEIYKSYVDNVCNGYFLR